VARYHFNHWEEDFNWITIFIVGKILKKGDSGDSEASVETEFSSGDVEAEFRLFSSASVEDGQETWAMHTNGTVKYNPQGGDVPPSVMPASYMKEVMERCPKTMDQKTFYQRMWDREYHLGKHFQWVGDVQYGDREGYSLFRAPMDAYETEGFEIFPGLIDAAFQLVAATFFDNVSGMTYIPFQIAGFYYYQKPDPKRRLWVPRSASAQKMAKCCTPTSTSCTKTVLWWRRWST
jgi:hypothetical protein